MWYPVSMSFIYFQVYITNMNRINKPFTSRRLTVLYRGKALTKTISLDPLGWVFTILGIFGLVFIGQFL